MLGFRLVQIRDEVSLLISARIVFLDLAEVGDDIIAEPAFRSFLAQRNGTDRLGSYAIKSLATVNRLDRGTLLHAPTRTWLTGRQRPRKGLRRCTSSSSPAGFAFLWQSHERAITGVERVEVTLRRLLNERVGWPERHSRCSSRDSALACAIVRVPLPHAGRCCSMQVWLYSPMDGECRPLALRRFRVKWDWRDDRPK